MAPGKLQLILVATLIVGSGRYAAHGQGEKQPPSKPTSARQREVNRLVGLFRRAHHDPEKQARIVQDAIQFGRPAVVALYGVIAREIYPGLKSYRNKFYQRAELVVRQRIGKVNLEEVTRLRETVLGLHKGDNFTKEAIIRQADPAMKRLAEMFLVDRTEVLTQSKHLQSERLKLQRLGLLWERCAVHLYKLMPNDRNKPKQPLNFEEYLQGEEDLAVKMAVPMNPQTLQVLVANAQLAARLEPEEARGILALNLMRNLLGLKPLAIDLKLCAAARDHSRNMHKLKFFSHESPVPGKTMPWDRAERFGTKAAAENIYHGAHDGRVAIRAWFHSPGHHKNMLGKYARVGLGRSGAFITVLFGR